MDSLHTGYRNGTVELLRIETNLFNLYIQGKPFHPTVEALQLHRDEEGALVNAHCRIDKYSSNLEISSISVFSPEENGLQEWEEGQACAPLFFETQAYEIVVEKKQDVAIQFYHENRYLREAVKPLGKNILSGILNFQNEVGFTELELRLHGQTLMQLQLEIFPTKMDYKKDYETILSDVNQQIYNLSFDFLRKTYHLTGLKDTTQQSMTEFFAILRHMFQHLVQAVERIKNAPHIKTSIVNQKVSSGKARHAGKGNLAYLSRHPELFVKDHKNGIIHINGQKMYPTHVLESKKYMDFDTGENRFVRWVLLRISKKLQALRIRLKSVERTSDPKILRNVDLMESQLQRLLRYDFLAVGEMTHMSVSLVLQMAPGYREVYRCYLMLMKGLSVQGDLIRLSLKDLAQLYEYWCFLKIHDLLSRKYELIKQDIVKVNRSGIFVKLDKTQKSKIMYRNPQNGEVFTLYYNSLPRGEQTPTVGQMPDNVLTLKKSDSSFEYKYIFDAKYRLNPAYEGTPYRKAYTNPGPEESDINTMHRYRDAIVYGDGQQELERSMFGAYVLFPYDNEEQFRGHKFYKSIELVNVGAFPFLPNATSLMEKFLDEIIMDSPEKAYERSTRPRGTKEYYSNKLEGKNVLVGSLREPSQLDVALSERFYHIPLKNIFDHKLLTQIEYIAMCQSRRKFQEPANTGIHWFGRIQDWKVVRRGEITERPARPGTEEELYVKFTIERWERRDNPIALGGQGIYTCLYTSKYIFDRAHEIAELKLENDEDLRKWREARRVGKVKVELDHTDVDLAGSVVGIRVEE
ncbi:restriction endonuclease-like protein [Paenibacillus woosongensis]|uniref:DUF2357 domain-containing protein n=1 Tax=Paenibacillus woosongensis TaxID=307580 RepID=A0A7X3CNP1_9BACL|nr:restriction endonuclease-like protein [Paenibacillus woosongensis]MUG46978.1 DUF2357 domain-containing protein [Paenibacillus woosongensis]